jgi:hypothetical protein
MAIFLALAETDAQEDAHEQAVQKALDFCKAALDAASEYDPSDSIYRTQHTCCSYLSPLSSAETTIRLALIGNTGREPHALRACKAIIRNTRRACKTRIENARKAHAQARWSR